MTKSSNFNIHSQGEMDIKTPEIKQSTPKVDFKELSERLEADFGFQILEGVTGIPFKKNKAFIFSDDSKKGNDYFNQDDKGIPYIKNFATDNVYFPVNAYIFKNNIEWKDGVFALAKDFRLLEDTDIKPKKNEKLTPKNEFTIQVKDYKDWLAEEGVFWFRYGLDYDLLERHEVLAVKSFSTHNTKGKPYTIYSNPENPIFAYKISENCFKIYKPFDPKNRFQWLGEKPDTFKDFWGIEQLPAYSDVIVICEGYKDCLSVIANKALFDADIWAVGKDNAKGEMDFEIISHLKSKCSRLILLLDNDEAGVEASRKHSVLHDLAWIKLPQLPDNQKDISDLFALFHSKTEGFENFNFNRLITDNLINPENYHPHTPQIANKSFFPIEAFPEPFQNIIQEVHQKICIPVEFLGLSILTVCSGAIGNTHLVKNGGRLEPCIIWGTLLGSSSSGKSRAMSFAQKPILDRQKYFERKFKKEVRDFEEAQKSAEAKNEVFDEPYPVKLSAYVKDFTFEGLEKVLEDNPKGFICLRDELASWYKTMNQYRKGADAQNWLSLWSGLEVKKNLASGRSLFLEMPFVSVLGGTQFNKLQEFAQEGRDEDGFMFRLLFTIAPKKEKPGEWIDDEVNSNTINTYSRLVNRLLDIELAMKYERVEKSELDAISSIEFDFNILEFSPEAKKTWKDWFDQNEILKFNSNDDKIDSLYGKLADYVPRIALILELMSWACNLSDKQNISDKSLQNAIRLIEYFRGTSLVVQKMIAEEAGGKIFFSKAEEKYYDALPNEKTFSNTEFVRIGKKFGFKEDNLKKKMLQRFIKLKLIERLKKDSYQKFL